MAGVQDVARRVVDVEENGVTPIRHIRTEPGVSRDACEEVSVDEAASWIGGQPMAQRKQLASMPLDHLVLDPIDLDEVA